MKCAGLILALILCTCCEANHSLESKHEEVKAPSSELPTAKASANRESARQSRSIRSIDFRSFTYDWYPDDGDNQSTGRSIELKGGEMNQEWGQEPRRFFLAGVTYGDVTGDGNEEAVVVIGMMWGTARPHVVLVYTMSGDQPKRLWSYESGDRAREGFHGISVENGQLTIELYKPIASLDDAGQVVELSISRSFTRNYYRWSGNEFNKVGSEERPNDPSDKRPWIAPSADK